MNPSVVIVSENDDNNTDFGMLSNKVPGGIEQNKGNEIDMYSYIGARDGRYGGI